MRLESISSRGHRHHSVSIQDLCFGGHVVILKTEARQRRQQGKTMGTACCIMMLSYRVNKACLGLPVRRVSLVFLLFRAWIGFPEPFLGKFLTDMDL